MAHIDRLRGQSPFKRVEEIFPQGEALHDAVLASCHRQRIRFAGQLALLTRQQFLKTGGFYSTKELHDIDVRIGFYGMPRNHEIRRAELEAAGAYAIGEQNLSPILAFPINEADAIVRLEKIYGVKCDPGFLKAKNKQEPLTECFEIAMAGRTKKSLKPLNNDSILRHAYISAFREATGPSLRNGKPQTDMSRLVLTPRGREELKRYPAKRQETILEMMSDIISENGAYETALKRNNIPFPTAE